MVPNALLRNPGLKPMAKLFAAALLSYAYGSTSTVEVSQGRIDSDLGMSRSAANAAFKKLVLTGLVKVESGTGETLKCDISVMRNLLSFATGTCSDSRLVPVAIRGTNNTGVNNARTRASGTRARKNTSSARSTATMPTDPNLSPEPDGLPGPTSFSSGSLVPVVSVTGNSHAREADRYLRSVDELQTSSALSDAERAHQDACHRAELYCRVRDCGQCSNAA